MREQEALEAENRKLRLALGETTDEVRRQLASLQLEYDALWREAEKRTDDTARALDQRDAAMRLLERAQAYFGPLHPIWKEIEALKQEPWDGVIDLPEEQP